MKDKKQTKQPKIYNTNKQLRKVKSSAQCFTQNYNELNFVNTQQLSKFDDIYTLQVSKLRESLAIICMYKR